MKFLSVARRTTIKKSVAMVACCGIVAFGASVITNGTSSTVARQNLAEPRELLEAIYFDTGPAAETLRSNGLYGVAQDANTLGQADLVIDQILEESPAFLHSFESALQANDPYLLEDVLRTGSDLMVASMPDLGMKRVSDGTGAGAVTLFVVFLWVIPGVSIAPTSLDFRLDDDHTLNARIFAEGDADNRKDVAAILRAIDAS
ncbi:hypothetical protein ACWIBQ_07895 [Microbacterium keratanolyticum]